MSEHMFSSMTPSAMSRHVLLATIMNDGASFYEYRVRAQGSHWEYDPFGVVALNGPV